jgi:outer membrane cobalamin receptor
MENENINRYNAGGWTSAAGEGLKSLVENRTLEMEANVAMTPFAGVTVLAGWDYEDLDWSTESIDLNTEGEEEASTRITNGASIYTRGVYAEVQYRPFSILKMTAGIRNETHAAFGDESVPRFGVVANPGESTVIKISHGKHFKAPTPYDLFWPEDDFARGNPNLEPQTGWHTDVSLEQELFDGGLFFEMSYFDWNVDGKIAWAPNPDFPGPWGDKWTPVNLTKTNGNGFEIGLNLAVMRNMKAAFSYTYTDAKEELASVSRNARYVPENQAKASMTWESGAGATAAATVRYTGKRLFYRSSEDVTPSDVFDAYTTVDLKAAYLFFEKWRVSVLAANILDETYDTYSEQFVDSGGNYTWGTFPGAERSVVLSVAYEH